MAKKPEEEVDDVGTNSGTTPVQAEDTGQLPVDPVDVNDTGESGVLKPVNKVKKEKTKAELEIEKERTKNKVHAIDDDPVLKEIAKICRLSQDDKLWQLTDWADRRFEYQTAFKTLEFHKHREATFLKEVQHKALVPYVELKLISNYIAQLTAIISGKFNVSYWTVGTEEGLFNQTLIQALMGISQIKDTPSTNMANLPGRIEWISRVIDKAGFAIQNDAEYAAPDMAAFLAQFRDVFTADNTLGITPVVATLQLGKFIYSICSRDSHSVHHRRAIEADETSNDVDGQLLAKFKRWILSLLDELNLQVNNQITALPSLCEHIIAGTYPDPMEGSYGYVIGCCHLIMQLINLSDQPTIISQYITPMTKASVTRRVMIAQRGLEVCAFARLFAPLATIPFACYYSQFMKEYNSLYDLITKHSLLGSTGIYADKKFQFPNVDTAIKELGDSILNDVKVKIFGADTLPYDVKFIGYGVLSRYIPLIAKHMAVNSQISDVHQVLEQFNRIPLTDLIFYDRSIAILSGHMICGSNNISLDAYNKDTFQNYSSFVIGHIKRSAHKEIMLRVSKLCGKITLALSNFRFDICPTGHVIVSALNLPSNLLIGGVNNITQTIAFVKTNSAACVIQTEKDEAALTPGALIVSPRGAEVTDRMLLTYHTGLSEIYSDTIYTNRNAVPAIYTPVSNDNDTALTFELYTNSMRRLAEDIVKKKSPDDMKAFQNKAFRKFIQLLLKLNFTNAVQGSLAFTTTCQSMNISHALAGAGILVKHKMITITDQNIMAKRPKGLGVLNNIYTSNVLIQNVWGTIDYNNITDLFTNLPFYKHEEIGLPFSTLFGGAIESSNSLKFILMDKLSALDKEKLTAMLCPVPLVIPGTPYLFYYFTQLPVYDIYAGKQPRLVNNYTNDFTDKDLALNLSTDFEQTMVATDFRRYSFPVNVLTHKSYLKAIEDGGKSVPRRINNNIVASAAYSNLPYKVKYADSLTYKQGNARYICISNTPIAQSMLFGVDVMIPQLLVDGIARFWDTNFLLARIHYSKPGVRNLLNIAEQASYKVITTSPIMPTTAIEQFASYLCITGKTGLATNELASESTVSWWLNIINSKKAFSTQPVTDNNNNTADWFGIVNVLNAQAFHTDSISFRAFEDTSSTFELDDIASVV